MLTAQQIADWQYEVANGDTVLGFAEWVAHKQESEQTYPCPHANCGYGECSGRWVNGACETHGNGEGRCQIRVNEDPPIVASGYVTQVNPRERSASSFLDAIELEAITAREALADEREGDFTQAVASMDTLTGQLHTIVKGW